MHHNSACSHSKRITGGDNMAAKKARKKTATKKTATKKKATKKTARKKK